MKRIFIVGLALLPVGVAQVKVEAKTTMQSRKTVSSEDRQWLKGYWLLVRCCLELFFQFVEAKLIVRFEHDP